MFHVSSVLIGPSTCSPLVAAEFHLECIPIWSWCEVCHWSFSKVPLSLHPDWPVGGSVTERVLLNSTTRCFDHFNQILLRINRLLNTFFIYFFASNVHKVRGKGEHLFAFVFFVFTFTPNVMVEIWSSWWILIWSNGFVVLIYFLDP